MTARRKNKTDSSRAAPAADPTHSPPPGSSASAKAEILRDLRAQLAALTGGMAPEDYLKGWWEWYLNLATQPPRQAQLAHSAYEKLLDSWHFLSRAAAGAPLPPGHENFGFGDAAWNVWPFNVYAHTYANWASWWQQALSNCSWRLRVASV